MTIVPELLIVCDNVSSSNTEVRKNKIFSPEFDYFRLPLFVATFFALFFKICFGLAGAIAWQEDETNLFGNIIFSKFIAEPILIATFIFTIFIIVPNLMQQQKQAKYFASVTSETEKMIPCN